MADLPSLGWRASLGYLNDPAGLVAAGRALGPVWRFRHPVHGLVPVVSDAAGATEVLRAGLHLAGRQRFLEWLGFNAPIGPIPATALLQGVKYVERAVEKTDPAYYLDIALRDRRHTGADVGPELREAALTWAINAVCQADQRSVQPALAAAISWSRAARTAPLLLPSLRVLCGRFEETAPARLRLLQAIAECEPGRELDGPLGSYLAGALLALLGPVVDALPMMAMAALCDPIHRRDIALTRAFVQAHPVPILLLETARFVELSRVGLQLDVDDTLGCTAGRFIGVDLVGAGMPFGVGPLATMLRVVATRFVAAALRTASRYDLIAVGPPKSSRIRLCVGPTSLVMSPWKG